MPNELTVSRHVSLKFFLLMLFITSAAGADPITCEMALPSGSTATKITLRSNTFWDTASGHHEYSPSVLAEASAFAAGMPASLKQSTGLSPQERAEQLRWALSFANHLQSPLPVELTLNPCYYDFSLLGAHQDTPPGDAELVKLSPKLYVGRNQLTILGLAHPATLGYDGPSTMGCGGTARPGQRCHGRVLMVVPRGLQGIKLLRLTFQGSHDAANFFVPERYLHENNAQLTTGKTRFGMLMIGYGPTNVNLGNDVLVNGCVFKKVNLRAIELSGNARILGNRFEGALPPPTGTASAYTNSLSCFTYPSSSFCSAFPGRPDLFSASGDVRFGMNWHSAISYRDFVFAPATTVIESNTIEDFVEGIVGGSLPHGSDIRFNTIRRIGDHGFYALGFVRRARIDSNFFERAVGQSIKIGGHGTRLDPLDEAAEWNTAAFETSISDNQFKLINKSAVLLAGTSNRIERNAHLAFTDPSGFFNLDAFPFIWISTYAGNTSETCGYYNHSAHNLINNNAGLRNDIFIQQLDDADWQTCSADRSIEGNQILEGSQKVYVRARPETDYDLIPNVQISGQNLLMSGFPENCATCEREHL